MRQKQDEGLCSRLARSGMASDRVLHSQLEEGGRAGQEEVTPIDPILLRRRREAALSDALGRHSCFLEGEHSISFTLIT